MLVGLNAIYQVYRRQVEWSRLARRFRLKNIWELRTCAAKVDGLRTFNMLGTDRLVVISQKRYQRFLRRTLDYPGNRQIFRSPFICRLDRPVVHVERGGVISSDGTLIAESVGGAVERFLPLVSQPPAEPRLQPGISATIMTQHRANYYHWLVDALPRTYLLAQMLEHDPIGLLVPESLAPFQRTSLLSCLPENIQLRFVSDEWVRAEHLVLPSFIAEPRTGFVPPECLTYLRTCLFRQLCLTDEMPRTRRLYISRAGTKHRRVINEEEVVSRLLKDGFEVVRPEELSLENQVRLFHSAEIVVGARGAALANILFSTRLKVLELTPASEFVGTVYFSLSHALGHEYYYCFGRPVGDDLQVDLGTLEKALVEMAAARQAAA